MIQRRRWANGGLIITPKLVKHVVWQLRRPGYALRMFPIRLHYLTSIAAVNIGLLVLLTVPFSDAVINPWIVLALLPYFYLYARDLKRLGYRGRDVLKVYAFDLLLIPVNLGGVSKSIEQGITKRKIPFGRTPKVKGHTAAPLNYLLAEYALLVLIAVSVVISAYEGDYLHLAYALINAAFFFYALKLLGVRRSFEDIGVQVRRKFRRRTTAR